MELINCTWKDCDKNGNHSQKDRYGNEWAFLCDEHNNELTESINSGIPKKILQSWIRANGGAIKLSNKM